MSVHICPNAIDLPGTLSPKYFTKTFYDFAMTFITLVALLLTRLYPTHAPLAVTKYCSRTFEPTGRFRHPEN